MKLIATIRGLNIRQDLGKGFQVDDGITILNNRDKISKLISVDLRRLMGEIEYHCLLDTCYAVFSDVTLEDLKEPDDAQAFIGEWLQIVRTFFQGLWLVRDHAVNCEFGFAEWQHPTRGNVCSSNFIASLNVRTGGSFKPESFTLEELKEAREYYRGALLPLASHSIQLAIAGKSAPSSPFYKGSRRLVRFNYFLAAARAEAEPAVRISLYMTCFEILFSSDAAELTHKLSERIAFFLSNESTERREIFLKMKRAYSIRSKIVHGATLSKKDEAEIASVAADIDNVLRDVFRKILADDTLIEQFEKADCEEFYTSLVFGGPRDGTSKNVKAEESSGQTH
jgi:hypothetical protein